MPHLNIRELFHSFDKLFIFGGPTPSFVVVDPGNPTLCLRVHHRLDGTALSEIIAVLAILRK
jgi:hypothetical protein